MRANWTIENHGGVKRLVTHKILDPNVPVVSDGKPFVLCAMSEDIGQCFGHTGFGLIFAWVAAEFT